MDLHDRWNVIIFWQDKFLDNFRRIICELYLKKKKHTFEA